MAKTPTQIRIDADIKQQATDLFNNLGLDMSSAVNLFLHQCVLRGGLPFTVEMLTANTHLMPWMKPDAFPMILTSRDIPAWTNCERHLKNKCTRLFISSFSRKLYFQIFSGIRKGH